MSKVFLFVHGTGVRTDDYRRSFLQVQAGLRGQWPGARVEPCSWGEKVGATLARGGVSIPDFSGEVPPTDEQAALAVLWDLLAVDPDGPGPDGEHVSLDALVAGVRAAGVAVDLREATSGALPPAVERCVHRIVQEGLTNALRHSSGESVGVRVDEADGEVSVAVDSTGERHLSSYGGSGRGLAGLRDRVEALGGELSAGPRDGGFVLSARLPLSRHGRAAVPAGGDPR